jgi:hypothetical protein
MNRARHGLAEAATALARAEGESVRALRIEVARARAGCASQGGGRFGLDSDVALSPRMRDTLEQCASATTRFANTSGLCSAPSA